MLLKTKTFFVKKATNFVFKNVIFYFYFTYIVLFAFIVIVFFCLCCHYLCCHLKRTILLSGAQPIFFYCPAQRILFHHLPSIFVHITIFIFVHLKRKRKQARKYEDGFEFSIRHLSLDLLPQIEL